MVEIGEVDKFKP